MEIGPLNSESKPGYRQLLAWQRAMDFAEDVYRLTKAWPKEEMFGLTSQLRRAASSIPANVAEGRGRASVKEYIYHLSVAYGSLCEAETHLALGQRLGYSHDSEFVSLSDRSTEVARLLHGLMKRLEERRDAIRESEVNYDSTLTPNA